MEKKKGGNGNGTKASGSGWVAVETGTCWHRWKEQRITHRMVVESLTLDG
jgi:hypothetical protein